MSQDEVMLSREEIKPAALSIAENWQFGQLSETIWLRTAKLINIYPPSSGYNDLCANSFQILLLAWSTMEYNTVT